MYVPAMQGLKPADFLHGKRSASLPFPLNAADASYGYMARNVIFQLFRALNLRSNEVVLMPDYNSGVEVWAVQSAGTTVRYYPVKRDLQPDLDVLAQLCETTPVRVLYVTHFFGWAQPIEALVALCRKYNLILIEDCALALLSESDGQPLGSTADYAVFCLFKTLPVPHGGVLVQNRHPLEQIRHMRWRSCSTAAVIGRSLDLLLERVGADNGAWSAALWSIKRAGGSLLSHMGIARVPVGDISPEFSSAGFALDSLDVGMSGLCHHLMNGFDYQSIRVRRRENFALLLAELEGRAEPLFNELPPGVCPLFFPLLVRDKHSAAKTLRACGVGATEIWNYGLPSMAAQSFADANYLRTHVLELPIHQDITAAQIRYMAQQILAIKDLHPCVSTRRVQHVYH